MMKKETILNILSLIVVIGAFLLELWNYKKETGELSVRSLLMDIPVSAENTVLSENNEVIEIISTAHFVAEY